MVENSLMYNAEISGGCKPSAGLTGSASHGKDNMKALLFCANGDGNPVCPPSKVICRKCMDKISSNLKNIITDMKRETFGDEAKYFSDDTGDK